MSTELCKCPTCLSSRAAAKTPISAVPDLGAAIREHRGETADDRQLRLTKALKVTPVEGEK
jgi:hypothetical protein